MKPFIEKLCHRSSVRDFTNDNLTKKDLKIIVDVINNAPSSFNMQQSSALIITKKQDKNFINQFLFRKDYENSAAFILFIADRTRLNYIIDKFSLQSNQQMQNHEFVRMITDAIISATQTHDALLDLGYGITFIGSILPHIDKINDYFKIPNSAFGVIGLSVGKPAKINPVKPKMNKVFFDRYNYDSTISELESYNNSSTDYFLNMPDKKTFIENTIKIFQNEKWIEQVILSSKKLQQIISQIK